MIRVQLSVILPVFDLSLSAKKAEMCFNTMIFFTLVISQPYINCQMIFRSNKFKTYSQTQPKLQNLKKCIWKYHFIRTSKTLHIVQITFQRRCAALLTKRRKLLFNLREIVPMYLSCQDTSILCTAEMMTVNQLLTSKMSNPCGAFWRMLSAHI